MSNNRRKLTDNPPLRWSGLNLPHKGSRPEMWISGPDPIKHQQYAALLKHRAQAAFRNEQHTITWEEWQELWPLDLWSQRGRKSSDLCLTRKDAFGAWSKDNCCIVTRIEHGRNQMAQFKGIPKKKTLAKLGLTLEEFKDQYGI